MKCARNRTVSTKAEADELPHNVTSTKPETASQINLLFTVFYAKFTRANKPHGSPILTSLLGRENELSMKLLAFLFLAFSGIRIGSLPGLLNWSFSRRRTVVGKFLLV